MPPKDYILWVSQDANFQSRTMLIPLEEFKSSRQQDYELLKSNSKKHILVNSQDSAPNRIIIDNLIIINLLKKDYGWQQKVTELTQLCNTLTQYANDGCDHGYAKLLDKNWVDLSLINLCEGFDHIKNYNKLKNMTKYKQKPVNIVDSFLVLESHDGEINISQYNTVSEMYIDTYL